MNITTTSSALVLSISLAACGSSTSPTQTAADFTELSAAVCDPANTVHSVQITNNYFPMPVGRVLILQGNDEGELVRLEIEVLDETEVVGGVTTRVVTETEFKDGSLYERTFNYFTQNTAGDVCYFGEAVEFFENDVVVSTSGTWRAEGGNKPGILMPATPQPMTQFFQEVAPGVAEDISAIDQTGLTLIVPAGSFTDVVGALDWNPLEGQTFDDAEAKFFAPGVGLIADEVMKLIEIR